MSAALPGSDFTVAPDTSSEHSTSAAARSLPVYRSARDVAVALMPRVPMNPSITVTPPICTSHSSSSMIGTARTGLACALLSSPGLRPQRSVTSSANEPASDSIERVTRTDFQPE